MEIVKDWAGVVFGLAGFIISIVTLIRSVKAGLRAEELRLNQRRQEAVALTVKAEIAFASVRKQLRDLRLDARIENVAKVVAEADKLIGNQDEAIQQVSVLRKELEKGMPARNEWRHLSDVIDTVVNQLQSFDAVIFEEQNRPFIDECRFAIHQEKELARKTGSQPN